MEQRAVGIRVTVTRSGGFAGLTQPPYELDSADLSSEDAEELERRVAAADFFELPSIVPAAAAAPDAFQYDVTVESGGRHHTVRAGDVSAPEALLDLVEHVMSAARADRS